MAAISDKDNTLDLTRLAEGLRKELPVYARPLFIRAVRDVEMTGMLYFVHVRSADAQKSICYKLLEAGERDIRTFSIGPLCSSY